MTVMLDNYNVSISTEFQNYNQKIYYRGKRKKAVPQNLSVDYVDCVKKCSVDSGYATLTKTRLLSKQGSLDNAYCNVRYRPGSGSRGAVKKAPVKHLPALHLSPKSPTKWDLSPKFSVKSVNPVGERSVAGRAHSPLPERRKLSDDYEVRRHELRHRHEHLSSVSLENFDKSNLLFCVRDSKELLDLKQASSSVHPVKRLTNQSAKLQQNIEHPKSYKHPREISEIQPAAKNSYSALYTARKKQQRKQHNITKQCYDNQVRREKQNSVSPVQSGDHEKVSTYPHTLPSALYDKPHPGEYPAFYDDPAPLPPILQYSVPPIQHHSSMQVERESESEYMNTESVQEEFSNMSTVRSVNTPHNTAVQGGPVQEEEVVVTDSYAAPNKPKITYKPYSYREYQAMKSTFNAKVGGLGPDTENSVYISKLQKAHRMSDYSHTVRNQHQKTDFPKRKVSRPKYIPPSKTKIANEYARRIAVPKVAHKTGYKAAPRQYATSATQEGAVQARVKLHMQHKQIIADLQKL